MKIVGQLVCGPGEADRWLEETLKDFARLCDDVVVCFCNATEKEKKLVRKYDFRGYDDDREWGKYQPAIKTRLLKTLDLVRPDGILALDADETVPTLTRESIEALARERRAFQLYVVDLWDDELHYSKELSFWNVRFYRPEATPDKQFLRKPVHCGNAPPFFYSLPAKETFVPHILLHKGLMLRADRLRKAERYQKYDPNAIHKGRAYYDALVSTGRASVYNESQVLKELQHYVTKFSPRN